MDHRPHRARTWAAIGLHLTLAACGGADSSNTTLTGQVLSASGVAVAGAQVVAMNRLTNREHNTITDDQGRYDLTLPQGHYDVGADDGLGKAASIVGAVSLSETPDKELNFNLPSQTADAMVTGTLYTSDKTPAAAYTLTLSSTHMSTSDDDKLSLTTTTDTQGRFEFQLGTQRLFDLDIYDPSGQWLEFVDLHKLDGPLDTTITLGEAKTSNVYRYDQAPLGPSDLLNELTKLRHNRPFDAVSDVDDIESRWTHANVLYRDTDDAKALRADEQDFSLCRPNGITEKGYVIECKKSLRNGELHVNAGNILINYTSKHNYADQVKMGMLEFPTSPESDEINDAGGIAAAELELVNSGNWFYDYAVRVRQPIEEWGNSADFEFTDATGDTYTLGISGLAIFRRWHTVSYNSLSPIIKKITIGPWNFTVSPSKWTPD